MKTIGLLLTIFSVVQPICAQSSFAFREMSGTALELAESGKPVFVYNFGMVLAPNAPEKGQHTCYLHPVYSPDGTVLTDDFNPDHPHHRGISWMWADVSVGGKRAICGR